MYMAVLNASMLSLRRRGQPRRRASSKSRMFSPTGLIFTGISTAVDVGITFKSISGADMCLQDDIYPHIHCHMLPWPGRSVGSLHFTRAEQREAEEC